jgi:hypothetical protein
MKLHGTITQKAKKPMLLDYIRYDTLLSVTSETQSRFYPTHSYTDVNTHCESFFRHSKSSWIWRSRRGDDKEYGIVL